MNFARRYQVGILALLFSVTATRAATLSDVTLADQIELGGQPLVLNGLGKRTKMIFSVYVAGLYLVKKEASAESVLALPYPKQLHMRFMRSVGADKIRESFADGLAKNCTLNCAAHEAKLKELLASVGDLVEGDALRLDFYADHVDFKFKDSPVKTVKVAADFPSALLSIWLGPNPPNEALKKGLLGIVK